MVEHFNKLTPAQLEALAILGEECGETMQVIGKIMRHGLESKNPNTGYTNLDQLHREIGDILAILQILGDLDIVDAWTFNNSSREKLKRIGTNLHHIELNAYGIWDVKGT